MSKYGTCSCCGEELSPVFFTEEETVMEGPAGYKHPCPTGRVRKAVDYLVCECCGHKEAVDDSFDGPWRYAMK